MSRPDRKDEFRIEWELRELGPKAAEAAPAVARVRASVDARALPRRQYAEATAVAEEGA